MAARIAVLQAPCKNRIQGCSRNHTELAELGYGLRKPPTGNTGTHSALNDRWKIVHKEHTVNNHYFKNVGRSLSEFCNSSRFLLPWRVREAPFRAGGRRQILGSTAAAFNIALSRAYFPAA